MAPRFTAGDSVQTSFGKGIVRELRNNGQLLVDVHGRALLLSEADISALPAQKSRRSAARPKADLHPDPPHPPREIDLHGLTVEEALARVEQALNDALLEDRGELRFIHGRSGGRIRSALHQRLKAIAAVKAFAVDPRNEGVTVVRL